MQFDAAQLEALDAAVSEGSLDAAARRLHVTPSAVSQRLRALESATGRVLLIRSRPVRPTESGQAVLRLARQVALLSADAAAELGPAAGIEGEGGRVAEVGDDAAPITLALAVNADSLATWFLDALAPLAPEVVFQLHRGDEGRTGDLLREGTVMAAVTTEGAALPGCTVTPLGAMRFRAMAAPAFAARWFGGGVDAASLARAPLVVFDDDDPLQHEELARRGVTARPPQHRIPSSRDFLEAVRLGFGWGMIPDLQAAALPAGSLVPLGADDPPVDVGLHWQQWRLETPSLRRVSEAVIAAGRAALVQPG